MKKRSQKALDDSHGVSYKVCGFGLRRIRFRVFTRPGNRQGHMRKTNGLLFAAALAATAGSAKAQVIGYDNSATYQGQYSNRGNVEVGDEIRLNTGGPSVVTRFDFEYNFSGPNGSAVPAGGSATGILRFWDNTGITVENRVAPGNLLFESSPFTITANANPAIVSHHAFVDNISVLVTETFYFSVDFNGVDAGEEAGLMFYSGAGVGSGPGQSLDESWENRGSGSTAQWVLVNTPGVFDNFGARVTVVPEPGTIALGIAGAAVLGLAARRRKA
jgi:hypothetical protein